MGGSRRASKVHSPLVVKSLPGEQLHLVDVLADPREVGLEEI